MLCLLQYLQLDSCHQYRLPQLLCYKEFPRLMPLLQLACRCSDVLAWLGPKPRLWPAQDLGQAKATTHSLAQPRPWLLVCGVILHLGEPLRTTGRFMVSTLPCCSSTPPCPRSPWCSDKLLLIISLTGATFGKWGRSCLLVAPTIHPVSSCVYGWGWVWCCPVSSSFWGSVPCMCITSLH